MASARKPRLTIHHIFGCQPAAFLQKLPWRFQATLSERDFHRRAEGQKVSGFAAPSVRNETGRLDGGSASPQSLPTLLSFCPSCEKISSRLVFVM
jgi:hypothetical protein